MGLCVVDAFVLLARAFLFSTECGGGGGGWERRMIDWSGGILIWYRRGVRFMCEWKHDAAVLRCGIDGNEVRKRLNCLKLVIRMAVRGASLTLM